MRIVFPSLHAPTERGFALDTDLWNVYWPARHCALSRTAFWFPTYGDGLTQHGPECACSVSQAADYCASLAQYVLDHPDKGLNLIAVGIPTVHRSVYEFLAGIRPRRNKDHAEVPTYYSISLQKQTSADRKFDSRFLRVPASADGSLDEIVGMFFATRSDSGDRTMTILERYSYIYELVKHHALLTRNYAWPTAWSDWRAEMPGLEQAYHALRCALLAAEKREECRNWLSGLDRERLAAAA